MGPDFALALEAMPAHVPGPMFWHRKHGAGRCPLVGPLDWGPRNWHASASSVTAHAIAHDVEMLDVAKMSWQWTVCLKQGRALVVRRSHSVDMLDLLGLFDLLTLHHLFDIVARDDDDDGHDNNRNQQPSNMIRLMTFPIPLIC